MPFREFSQSKSEDNKMIKYAPGFAQLLFGQGALFTRHRQTHNILVLLHITLVI